MITVGVGNKDLSETLSPHKLHNLFNAVGIKFVEDIVEKQQRSAVRSMAKEIELCQFQGQSISLVLPLTTLSLHLITIKKHLKIITMHAMK